MLAFIEIINQVFITLSGRKMHIYNLVKKKIYKVLKQVCQEHQIDMNSLPDFVVETPKNHAHGELATNIALVMSKFIRRKPLDFANDILDLLMQDQDIKEVSIANPGFINLVMQQQFWLDLLTQVPNVNYGSNSIMQDEYVNIEYVSANPTGPLHIGHCRGAVVGDVLANLYNFCGAKVAREFYINDAGSQIDNAAYSVYYQYLRLLEEQHIDANFEELYTSVLQNCQQENFYQGEYVIDLAKKIIAKDQQRWLTEFDLAYFKRFTVEENLAQIKRDLALLEVKHDLFVAESLVCDNEAYQQLLQQLMHQQLLYHGVLPDPKGKNDDNYSTNEQPLNVVKQPLLLFKSTQFGDDVDRSLEKADGSRTYFANDLVYHNYKLTRGFTKLINIWGSDHLGYILRMQAGVAALSNQQVALEVNCCQLVSLLNNGIPYKMSKRKGNFVTLADLVELIGKDATRLMMLSRKNDMALELDIAKIRESSTDNLVFYIQYAYARINSVVNHAKKQGIDIDINAIDFSNFAQLNSKEEGVLIRNLVKFPACIEGALINHDLHRLYNYLFNLASDFHQYWNAGKIDTSLRFILQDNQILTIARVSLLMLIAKIIKQILDILGIRALEIM